MHKETKPMVPPYRILNYTLIIKAKPQTIHILELPLSYMLRVPHLIY